MSLQQPINHATELKFGVPSALLVSLCTSAFLPLLVSSKALQQSVESLSIQSEELLRGDRLPILKFPR